MSNLHNSALIIAETGPLSGNRWILDSDFIIGRDADCDLVINDRQISRQHARIFYKDNNFFIEDLNSKNGTYINKNRINMTAILNESDCILIGMVQELIFFASDSTIPLNSGKLFVNRIYIDIETMNVWIDEKLVDPPFSQQQYSLLSCLYSDQGNVVPREEIIRKVWKNSFEEGVSNEAVDALVRRLRRHIAEYDKSHEYIKTIRGFGFRLDNPKKNRD